MTNIILEYTFPQLNNEDCNLTTEFPTQQSLMMHTIHMISIVHLSFIQCFQSLSEVPTLLLTCQITSRQDKLAQGISIHQALLLSADV